MTSIQSVKSYLVFLLTSWLLLLLLPDVVHGCSCVWPGDNAAARANHIINDGWTSIAVIARFINETSYSSNYDENDDDYLLTFQNTSFVVNEIVYNRDPNGTLPSDLIDIQADGTMVFSATTETSCCICGRYIPPETIGKDYFLPISGSSLSDCADVCLVEQEWCNDIATELRNMSGGGVGSVTTAATTAIIATTATVASKTSASISTIAAADATTANDIPTAATTAITATTATFASTTSTSDSTIAAADATTANDIPTAATTAITATTATFASTTSTSDSTIAAADATTANDIPTEAEGASIKNVFIDDGGDSALPAEDDDGEGLDTDPSQVLSSGFKAKASTMVASSMIGVTVSLFWMMV